MKTRKQMLRQYFMEKLTIDLSVVDELKRQPQAQISFMGGVRRWYMETGCMDAGVNYSEAIAFAGYKFPDSDRTWLTAIHTAREVAEIKWDRLGLAY